MINTYFRRRIYHEFELCFPNLDDETFKCISHLSNKMKEENEVNQISNTVE